MKLLKKFFAFCLFVAILASTMSQKVDACDKTSGCFATGVNVTCGAVNGYEVGQHTVKEPNGYLADCRVTIVSGPHTLYCAACKAYLGTADRKCSEVHSNSHCYSRYNLCK